MAAVVALLALVAACAPAALADFPYLPKSGGDPHDPSTWKLAPGEVPSNLNDNFKYAATPEAPSPQNLGIMATNAKQSELCGIRGASVVDEHATMPASTGSCVAAGTPIKTAWEVTTGRPDVVIAVLDSGIEWNDGGVMTELRKKVRINAGELPAPQVDGSVALDPSVDCAALAAGGAHASGGDFDAAGGRPGAGGVIPYDVNDDGVFNVLDYACDPRVADVVAHNTLRHGPAGMLTPEDLIYAFSDGSDHDHNGYVDDIAGWNYVDDNNDPYDDVQYSHGSGEARDSTAEANVNTGDVGSCTNCMVLPLRVGESFIADANRFAQAVLYATDSGVSVVQEALGTINESDFARRAIDYAYAHGTAIIASAADEAAEHHNQPGSLPHTIVVNSVTRYDDESGFPLTPASPSYLAFNGCTNFSTKLTVAIPSTSCSSDATGRGAGIAGLIYSAALNAIHAGKLSPAADCTRVDGSPCPITANEVRQLMASGDIGASTPADEGGRDGAGGQADDVNFMNEPEPSCTPPTPTCTDPNSNFGAFSAEQNGGDDGSALVTTRRYPARKGFDEFYGYGRVNAYTAVEAAADGVIPPEAEIDSPDWFQQIDPAAASVPVDGHVSARGVASYTCELDVAPGGQPNNADDFHKVSGGFCDGSTPHTGAFDGRLGAVDVAALKAMFPPTLGFTGNENGGTAQTSNGRPNTMPYAFTVRVVVRTGSGPSAMSGEDRRQLWLHRDADMLAGFPKELKTDGDSSPLLVDLDGDDRNEMVLATSDGVIHAWRRDGTELPGWPVHTDPLPLHTGAPAYGTVGTDHYGAVLGALAAGDLFHDGRTEIVADDNDGKVYAWDAAGHRVFSAEATPGFAESPIKTADGLKTVRNGPRDRTEHGFLASPALAHLDGDPNGTLDIVVPGEDRHLYAWHADGTPVAGFPVEIYDHDKASIDDPATGHLTFNANALANPDIDEDQGKLVDTPAIAQLDGPDKPPSIVLGSNEEYTVNAGDEGGLNAGGVTAASLGVIGQTGVLKYANGRLYVVKHDGDASGQPYRAGWPKKVGIVEQGLLPDVAEGVSGPPVVGPVDCGSNGGSGPKIAAMAFAGPGYVFSPDGSSCYGQDSSGHDNPLEFDFSGGPQQYDHPAIPAVGNPSFATLDGSNVSVVAPVAGVQRALDAAFADYQGGQDFIGAWNGQTGQYQPGFPTPVNDLQFLTGQAVGDILGLPGQEIVGGTASLDLAAVDAAGAPASTAWPKLTGDWIVATPTLGSFGTLDTDAAAKKDVVTITRAGTLSVYGTQAGACSPSSWPRYHHDDANSGDYTRDATQPGVPLDAKVAGSTLTFTSPGDDLLCGTADHYEAVSSDQPITPQSFAAGQPIAGLPKPAAAGGAESIPLPAGTKRYVAIRAVDEAGNLGLPAVVDTAPSSGGGSNGGGSSGNDTTTTPSQTQPGAGGATTQTAQSGNGPSPGSGPAAGGLSPAVQACLSARTPRSSIARHHSHASRRRLVVSGHASERSCPGFPGRITKVSVAVWRVVAHGRCRFLHRDGTFGPAESCRHRIYLRARGRTAWALRVAGRLPRGRYHVLVHAVGSRRRREHTGARNRLTLRVH